MLKTAATYTLKFAALPLMAMMSANACAQDLVATDQTVAPVEKVQASQIDQATLAEAADKVGAMQEADAAVAPSVDKATQGGALSLPMGTTVMVMTNSELNTKDNKLGDFFDVTVLNDVVDQGVIVIPKGTIGYGEVTTSIRRGGFGKAGIVGVSLRYLELNGKKVLLDGRFREEGKNKNGATAATWFAVGVFSGFIKGQAGVIPKGRELKARTGEEIAYGQQNQSDLIVEAATPLQNASSVGADPIKQASAQLPSDQGTAKSAAPLPAAAPAKTDVPTLDQGPMPAPISDPAAAPITEN
jgi:hypothetical protein